MDTSCTPAHHFQSLISTHAYAHPYISSNTNVKHKAHMLSCMLEVIRIAFPLPGCPSSWWHQPSCSLQRLSLLNNNGALQISSPTEALEALLCSILVMALSLVEYLPAAVSADCADIVGRGEADWRRRLTLEGSRDLSIADDAFLNKNSGKASELEPVYELSLTFAIGYKGLCSDTRATL